MKVLLFAAALLLPLCGEAAKCVGAAPCRACKNCKNCKHCQPVRHGKFEWKPSRCGTCQPVFLVDAPASKR